MTQAERFILNIKCPDRKGVVAAVSSHLAGHDASIVESQHFNDVMTDQFYMRTVFRADGPNFPAPDALRNGLEPIAKEFSMDWELVTTAVKPRLLIAVSKAGHCLYDLMHRWRSGLLNVEIAGVVSNHDDMRSFVEWSGVPYYHFPIAPGQKAQQEGKILELVDSLRVDLVVLARYMQVLTPAACAALFGRCINIHHSFLPSFKGAKPYHQAHARGVKITGATAHYVTTDLDEGPIIEQGVQRVTHADTPEKLIAIGRDIECTVLARAVLWHVERRVIITGQKTVVLS